MRVLSEECIVVDRTGALYEICFAAQVACATFSILAWGAPSQNPSQVVIGVTQWKRESVKNQPVVGAVREPPAPEHGPFSYRTASVLL